VRSVFEISLLELGLSSDINGCLSNMNRYQQVLGSSKASVCSVMPKICLFSAFYLSAARLAF